MTGDLVEVLGSLFHEVKGSHREPPEDHLNLKKACPENTHKEWSSSVSNSHHSFRREGEIKTHKRTEMTQGDTLC